MVNYMDSFVTNCAGGLSGGGARDFFAMTRYETVSAYSLRQLTADVNTKAEEGYDPIGGPVRDAEAGQWVQAMQRRQSEAKPEGEITLREPRDFTAGHPPHDDPARRNAKPSRR